MNTPKNEVSSPTQSYNPFSQPKFNPTMGRKAETRPTFKRDPSATQTAPPAPRKMSNPVKSQETQAPIPKPDTPEPKKKEGVQVFSQGDGKKAKFSIKDGSASGGKSKPKKSRKRTLITMLIALLILAGGLVGFSAYYFNWIPSFASEPKPAAESTSPFNNDNIEHSVLKDKDLVKFGDGETTYKVDGEVRVNNISHPEEATIAFVYLTPLEGESGTNIITLKEDKKVSFEDGDTIYTIDSFEFNNKDITKATLCKVTIHEMSKTDTTKTESSTSDEATTSESKSDTTTDTTTESEESGTGQ
ncbi:hypothetical protein ACFL24_02100 [Patescibacteria group bacterium]